MVIDVDRGFLPLAVDVTRNRKRREGGLVELVEEFLSGRIDSLKWAVIDLLEEFGDGFVDLHETVERPLSQPGDYPSLCYGDAHLDDSFVSGLADAGRYYGGAVVSGHFGERRSYPVRTDPAW